jgi:hypothetical protein
VTRPRPVLVATYAAAGAAVRGGKVTPVGATGSKVRFARHPPRTRNRGISPPALLDE